MILLLSVMVNRSSLQLRTMTGIVLSFLQRCDERGVHLNSDKLQLRIKEVPFIGHVATGECLPPDPSKVRAIREMPPPENVAGIQRILGMSQTTLVSFCRVCLILQSH